MGIAKIASAIGFNPDWNYSPAPAIDTTGANLIVVMSAGYNAADLCSDNKGNSWTKLTKRGSSGVVWCYYCLNPTVGSGHTFSVGRNGYGNIEMIMAFSGVKNATAFDQESGRGDVNAASLQPGSLTPAENGELLITGLYNGDARTPTINSGFTREFYYADGTTQNTGAMGYLIQGTAAAINPTWSWSGSVNSSVEMACFKAAAVASANVPLAALIQNGGINV